MYATTKEKCICSVIIYVQTTAPTSIDIKIAAAGVVPTTAAAGIAVPIVAISD